jgi:hypothetical protein
MKPTDRIPDANVLVARDGPVPFPFSRGRNLERGGEAQQAVKVALESDPKCSDCARSFHGSDRSRRFAAAISIAWTIAS